MVAPLTGSWTMLASAAVLHKTEDRDDRAGMEGMETIRCSPPCGRDPATDSTITSATEAGRWSPSLASPPRTTIGPASASPASASQRPLVTTIALHTRPPSSTEEWMQQRLGSSPQPSVRLASRRQWQQGRTAHETTTPTAHGGRIRSTAARYPERHSGCSVSAAFGDPLVPA